MTDSDETKLIIEEALQSKHEWEKFKREWEKAVRALNPNAKDKKSQAKHLASRMNKAQNFCYFTEKKALQMLNEYFNASIFSDSAPGPQSRSGSLRPHSDKTEVKPDDPRKTGNMHKGIFDTESIFGSISPKSRLSNGKRLFCLMFLD